MDSKFDPRKATSKVGTVERSGDKGTSGTVKQVEILAKGPRPGGLERLTSHRIWKGQGSGE